VYNAEFLQGLELNSRRISLFARGVCEGARLRHALSGFPSHCCDVIESHLRRMN
jgi:hypothetical protein